MLYIKEKELQRFCDNAESLGFKKIVNNSETHYSLFERKENEPKTFYKEKYYKFDDSKNTIKVVTERTSSDWKHFEYIKQIYVFASDYEMGISEQMLDKIFDLITQGYIEKLDKS